MPALLQRQLNQPVKSAHIRVNTSDNLKYSKKLLLRKYFLNPGWQFGKKCLTLHPDNKSRTSRNVRHLHIHNGQENQKHHFKIFIQK